MINNYSHNKVCLYRSVQIHVEAHLIPLIKSDIDMKLEKYCIKINSRRNPTSKISDMYKFKMALFDNGSQLWVLLFQRNYPMILEA